MLLLRVGGVDAAPNLVEVIESGARKCPFRGRPAYRNNGMIAVRLEVTRFKNDLLAAMSDEEKNRLCVCVPGYGEVAWMHATLMGEKSRSQRFQRWMVAPSISASKAITK